MRYLSLPAKAITITIILAAAADAQVQPPPAPWRGAGPVPCVGPEGGIFQCPEARGVTAIRAGRLFDSSAGRMLRDQIVVVTGDRIAEVGAEGEVEIPAGARLIDLGEATVLPGLIDAHTHMFNRGPPDQAPELAMLIAVQNAQADLRAGFTSARDMSSHGHGYADVVLRDAIDDGRIDGPRLQVATRGIAWAAEPADPARPENPLDRALVRNADQARAAVREQIAGGADWIKLYPGGAYSFDDSGVAHYEVTYPLPVLEALIDETHRLGRKAACHVLGGEGQKNAILAGCDSIEHAFGLVQAQADMMVEKGLNYVPTLVRYTEPYMDDNDARDTGGRYRMIPIFERAVTMAGRTPGLKITIGSGADGSTYPHGAQALDFEALVKQAHFSPARAIQAGTSVNAEMLGWQDEVGSIEKGKYADLIAVAGDPLTDITELQRVKLVIKGGKLVRNDF